MRIVIYIIVVFSAFVVSAQDNFENSQSYTNFEDTFHIQELDVVSPVSGKYQVGVKTISFTSDLIETSGTSLEQVINRMSPIYGRSDAGGLSTIRMRGTSPDHTSVMVGELNVNSLTLGHSNASNIPSFLFDNIAIQFGGSAAENGSGAIGGAIKLNLNREWVDGVKAKVQFLGGSFGENLISPKIYLGNGKFTSVTRAYNYAKKNDFLFLTNKYDFETKSFPKEKQRFASVHNKGVLQELNYRFSDNETFTSFFWFENNWHEAQPQMGANRSESLSSDPVESEHTRIYTEYENKNHPFVFKIGAGGVKDYMLASGSEIITNRFVASGEIGRTIKAFKIKLGGKYKYITPEVYTYAANLTEEQFDAYLSVFHQASTKLKLTANFRQQWVSNYDAPFTPSIGADYLIMSTAHSVLSGVANASLSYRIPSFNDRYWGYQGNPNLNPEKGSNVEVGLKYSYCEDFYYFNVSAQVFTMDIDDWIQWIPTVRAGKDSIPTLNWFPENVQRVLSRGVEYSADVNFDINPVNFHFGINYTYNKSVRVSSYQTSDKLNQQLHYAPAHLSNMWFAVKYQKYGLNMDYKYTGKRYYNDLNTLDAYGQLNAGVSYTNRALGRKYGLNLNVINLLDKQFQNVYNLAMPGRYGRISIRINI